MVCRIVSEEMDMSLTPDVAAEGKGDKKINTLIKTMKPDPSNNIIESIMSAIDSEIEERYERYNTIEKWRK